MFELKVNTDKRIVYNITYWVNQFLKWLGSASSSMRLINPLYFRVQSVTNLMRALFSRGPHFVGRIQEVMIKILKEIRKHAIYFCRL